MVRLPEAGENPRQNARLLGRYNQFLENFEYDLSGTPCEAVLAGETRLSVDIDLMLDKGSSEPPRTEASGQLLVAVERGYLLKVLEEARLIRGQDWRRRKGGSDTQYPPLSDAEAGNTAAEAALSGGTEGGLRCANPPYELANLLRHFGKSAIPEVQERLTGLFVLGNEVLGEFGHG